MSQIESLEIKEILTIVFGSDADLSEITDVFCARYAYQALIPNPDKPGELMPNPESREDFRDRIIAGFIKDNVMAYRNDLDNAAKKDRVGDVTVIVIKKG